MFGHLVILTGDYRGGDLTAGFAPPNPSKKEWLALEANYGNGLMLTLEHRNQLKWNAMRVSDAGNHEISLQSALRRGGLDHYNFNDPALPSYYGPFILMDGNNVTIAPVTPDVAG